MNDDTKEQDENRALSALTEIWGDRYEIYLTGDQWQAWHKGAPLEGMLDGATPDELNAQIQADAASRRSAP